MAYSKQKTFLELTQLLIRSLSSDHVWMERSYCIPILVILLCVSASMFNQAGLKARLDGFQDKKQSVSECLAFAPSLDSHRFACEGCPDLTPEEALVLCPRCPGISAPLRVNCTLLHSFAFMKL